MADLEEILQDEKSWIRFDCKGEGDICVYRRCPKCGRYITTGSVNMGGDTNGWQCKTHGEVEPFWLRD